ncbi:MAG: hypothetical protein ABH863_00615 [Candidatus Micrarchaeota archaeon]
MGKFAVPALVLLALLLLASPIRAAPDIVIINYTLSDKDGNMIGYGYSPSQTNALDDSYPPSTDYIYNFTQNITAGDYFFINLTILNKGTDEEPVGQLIQSDVRDFNGNFMGDNSNYFAIRAAAAIDNFTNRVIDQGNPANSNPFSISQGENITINSSINTSKYLYEGNYSLLFAYFGSSEISEKYQWLLIPINNSGKSFYVNITSMNFTDYNDISFFQDNTQNWTLNLNYTLTNLGTIDPPVTINFSGLFCRSDDIARSYSNCSTPPLPKIYFSSYLQETQHGCARYNVSNTTNLHCTAFFENSTFGFRSWHEFDMGPLGEVANFPVPLQKITWDYFISPPYTSSLFAVPGLPFNLSFGFFYIITPTTGAGNITTEDNFNLTFKGLSSSFASVFSNSELVWKGPPFSFNVSNIIGTNRIFDINLTETVPPGADIAYAQMLFTITEPLNETIHYYRPQWFPNIPCYTKPFTPMEVSVSYPWCEYFLQITSANLIYLVAYNSPYREMWVYGAPGSQIPVQFELRNPFPQLETYSISSAFAPTSFQNFDPITITLNSPEEIPRSYSTGPGKKTVGLSANIPYGTLEDTYTYHIRSTLDRDPTVTDFALLHIVVEAHDLEIVNINKLPNRFAYNPGDTDRVNLTVTIKNNFGVFEQASLTLDVIYPTGTVTYSGCGGAILELSPDETRTLNCRPPATGIENAHADLTNLLSDNIVVVANLQLLAVIDSKPENNYRVEIISVISSDINQETVPEIDPAVFLALLLLSLFALRKVRPL